MDRSRRGGHIDEAMQPLPGAAAEPADHGVVGGDGERHQDDERQHADGDVGPLDDVGPDGGEVEALVEHHVDGEMQRRVVEGEQADARGDSG